MTSTHDVIPPRTTPSRKATLRHYAMTPPTYFTVQYAINPWMDTAHPVEPRLARTQWEALRQIYLALGHRVDLVRPRPGLPDMVYAANGGFIRGNTAVVAKFAYPQRAPEAEGYAEWMAAQGLSIVTTQHVNEGQGDLLLVGSQLLAGWGFRTDRRAHAEIGTATGLSVTSLELVDPRFYHLDTALAVLDDATIAYYPAAFSTASRQLLRERYPDALIVADSDAHVLGLNVVSDGRHVVLPAAATGFSDQLRQAGFEPIGVELSELLKGGGSVKCCTLEAHTLPPRADA